MSKALNAAVVLVGIAIVAGFFVLGGLGLFGPSYGDIDVQRAWELIRTNKNNTDFVVLDVRTPEEVSEGITPHTQVEFVTYDFYQPDFADKIASLERDKTYLVYCRSGNRSEQAVSLMNEMGFKRVYNVTGGFNAWREAGLPVASR